MRSTFHDPAVFHHQDLVRPMDGGEPVRDHKGGPSFHQICEPLKAWTIARLAYYLASIHAIEHPVLNKTGLDGLYGLTLSYSTVDNHDRSGVFTFAAVTRAEGIQPDSQSRAHLEMV
jgi:hypothetical protein